jgi:hypothetical protein
VLLIFLFNYCLLACADDLLAGEARLTLPLPLPSEVGQWRVLDAGCGSGLIGRLFTSLVGLPAQSTEALLLPPPPQVQEQEEQEDGQEMSWRACAAGPCMLGVDVSPKMARLALANGGYSATLCADLDAVLRQFSGDEQELGGEGGVCGLQPLDMLVAADTFLYVGPLEEVRESLHFRECVLS